MMEIEFRFDSIQPVCASVPVCPCCPRNGATDTVMPLHCREGIIITMVATIGWANRSENELRCEKDEEQEEIGRTVGPTEPGQFNFNFWTIY